MEKTFNVNQRNKILKMNHKKTPTNSLDFIPISIKQNSDSHYFTSITESKNKNLKDKNLDNLLHSNTKLKLSKIRNIGRNIIRSVTPNQSKKNLIDNNINSNQSYLKLSLLPDIYKNNITDSSYKENNYLNKQLHIINVYAPTNSHWEQGCGAFLAAAAFMLRQARRASGTEKASAPGNVAFGPPAKSLMASAEQTTGLTQLLLTSIYSIRQKLLE